MSAMNAAQRREYLDFAREIAREAGQVTLAYFRRNPEAETKADRTPVTIADRESERLLRRRIHDRYPNHGILGEEEGLTAGSGELTWILDPIDGTLSFLAGVPLYAVLVALVSARYDGTTPLPSSAIEIGVLYVPPLDEMVSAARGLGATWHNGLHESPASVSSHSSVKGARIGATDLADLHKRDLDFFATIAGSADLLRTWGDAYGYLLVATGRFDAMIDPTMSPWDVGPLPVIVEEAGGRFTDLSGDEVLGTSGIASNGALHDELLLLRH